MGVIPLRKIGVVGDDPAIIDQDYPAAELLYKGCRRIVTAPIEGKLIIREDRHILE